MNLSDSILSAIDGELRHQISRLDTEDLQAFHKMLTYHMGWTGEVNVLGAGGKRIRPLLQLLITSACGGDWQSVLPAAAAIELVHNFSLVHDDIEDNSDMRRGRLTTWKKWGIPMAINTGDALFVISDLALMDLLNSISPDIVLRVADILHKSCLELTCGQYLDMEFENRNHLSINEYWVMIEGKTANLIGASCKIGAILGGANSHTTQLLADFGHLLGKAFQAQDDFLGIWGSDVVTGKSNRSDLLSGKKTLPILYGINGGREFHQRWQKGKIEADELPFLADLLIHEGAQEFTQEIIITLTNEAVLILRQCDLHGEAMDALFCLVEGLLGRNS